jgi:hypothetical protein
MSSEAEHVMRSEERYETPKWRTLGLLAGFLVLVGIGVVTVLLPELEDEPDRAGEMPKDAIEEASHTDPLQE